EMMQGDLHIDARPDRLSEVNLLVEVVLLDPRQQEGSPAPTRPDIEVRRDVGVGVAIDVTGRKTAVGVVIAVESQADLMEVVAAPHAAGSLADLLHGRQQQTHEGADDGNHHQQLNQREGVSHALRHGWSPSVQLSYTPYWYNEGIPHRQACWRENLAARARSA